VLKINMERETGFEPATLALARRNRHNEPDPIFRDFFILSHFPTLHCTDTFHMDPVFCPQSSTNLAQLLSRTPSRFLSKTGLFENLKKEAFEKKKQEAFSQSVLRFSPTPV